MTEATQTQTATRGPRKMAREPHAELPPALSAPKNLRGAADEASPAASDKPQSKSALVLDLLRRPEGATIEQLVEATGWLRHSTRAALTGLKKKGHAIVREKRGNVSTYSIACQT